VTDIFKMHAAQQITPAIMKTYPLESFQTALDLFAKKKSIGKIVLTTSRS
jgi:NADPH:quinone reductase-like Zn-dependent oxidoreductase